MKQSTTFLSLIQSLLSEEELTSILQEVGYEDTARTFDTRTFIEYLVTAAVSEWKSFRHGADVANDYGLHRVVEPSSPVLRDVTCQLGTKQNRTKKRHRVVIFKDVM